MFRSSYNILLKNYIKYCKFMSSMLKYSVDGKNHNVNKYKKHIFKEDNMKVKRLFLNLLVSTFIAIGGITANATENERAELPYVVEEGSVYFDSCENFGSGASRVVNKENEYVTVPCYAGINGYAYVDANGHTMEYKYDEATNNIEIPEAPQGAVMLFKHFRSENYRNGWVAADKVKEREENGISEIPEAEVETENEVELQPDVLLDEETQKMEFTEYSNETVPELETQQEPKVAVVVQPIIPTVKVIDATSEGKEKRQRQYDIAKAKAQELEGETEANNENQETSNEVETISGEETKSAVRVIDATSEGKERRRKEAQSEMEQETSNEVETISGEETKSAVRVIDATSEGKERRRKETQSEMVAKVAREEKEDIISNTSQTIVDNILENIDIKNELEPQVATNSEISEETTEGGSQPPANNENVEVAIEGGSQPPADNENVEVAIEGGSQPPTDNENVEGVTEVNNEVVTSVSETGNSQVAKLINVTINNSDGTVNQIQVAVNIPNEFVSEEELNQLIDMLDLANINIYQK